MTEIIPAREALPEGVIERYETHKMAISTIGKPMNCRLLFSTPPRAEELYPGTKLLREKLLATLAVEASRYGIKRIYVPRVDEFNAHLARPEVFINPEIEIIGNDIELLRSDDPSFFHDGVILKPGEAAFIITGDCPTIATYSDDETEPIIASHAGRNSLHTVNHKHRTNSNSVVDEIAKQYRNPESVHLRIIAGIGKEQFTHPLDHPTYGEHNRKLVQYFAQFGAADPADQKGCLDLIQAITSQAVANGVFNDISWDGIDTTTDPRFWSNRRDGKPRNGILVCARPLADN
jgi:hypothetical protein